MISSNILFSMATILLVISPDQASLSPAQERVLRAGAIGLSAEAAACAGICRSQFESILLSVDISEVLVPGSGTETPDPHSGERVCLRAVCVAASIPTRVAERLQQCADAEYVGLPPEWGCVAPNAQAREELARCLVAERRAARLGRTLDAAAADRLSVVRATAEVIAAEDAINRDAPAIRSFLMGE